jgi:hypothetical protein
MSANDLIMNANTSNGGEIVLKGDANFLTAIDFSQIDEMDPNFFNGHRAIFDSDVSLEIKIIDDSTAMLLPGSH